MQKSAVFFVLMLFIGQVSVAQSLEAFPVTDQWKAHITDLVPEKTTVPFTKQGNVLLFPLFTGFQHWVIPHSSEVIKAISNKTGAYKVDETVDVTQFTYKNLRNYDIVVLNNTCSIGPRRNLFYDALSSIQDTVQRAKKAEELEKCLLKYVRKGGGLMVLHGAIVMQNNSDAFGDMVGGHFEYHPIQQNINVQLVDANHPLVRAFDGKGFTHYDEPYFFKDAYFEHNFRPLLYMDTNELVKLKNPVSDNIRYVSWIKQYGKGRVFYTSPSHNAQSYDNPDLIAFFMDAMQYLSGDLKCDDSPIGK